MSDPAPSTMPEPTPFERMRALAMRVLSVPKSEVDKRERQWKKDRAAKKFRKA
jgi:hypothetical protein